VRVDDPICELRDDLLAENSHESGGHDEIRAPLPDPSAKLAVPLFPISPHRDDEGRNTCSLGSTQGLSVVNVRSHGYQGFTQVRIDDGLKQAAGARREDDDSRIRHGTSLVRSPKR
jgi:hypothetical protein